MVDSAFIIVFASFIHACICRSRNPFLVLCKDDWNPLTDWQELGDREKRQNGSGLVAFEDAASAVAPQNLTLRLSAEDVGQRSSTNAVESRFSVANQHCCISMCLPCSIRLSCMQNWLRVPLPPLAG